MYCTERRDHECKENNRNYLAANQTYSPNDRLNMFHLLQRALTEEMNG